MNEPLIHDLADVQTELVGTGCRIWQYVVVLPGAKLGMDCNILPNCLIGNDVVLGDRVQVSSGVQIGDGLRIGDDVFVGPNVSFGNDILLHGESRKGNSPITTIHDGASIGAGAVISPGIEIGAQAMVAAGTVVTRSVPPNAVVEGNPSKIVGYANSTRFDSTDVAPAKPELGATTTKVAGVTLHRMPRVLDIRGNLTVGEFERNVPFSAKRYFMVFDVPSMETRGEHAHRACHQFLICVRGSCALLVDDGTNRQEFHLDQPDIGIHVPPMVWGIQYKYSEDAVLLVFASHYYDGDDYIRDYSEYIKLVRSA